MERIPFELVSRVAIMNHIQWNFKNFIALLSSVSFCIFFYHHQGLVMPNTRFLFLNSVYSARVDIFFDSSFVFVLVFSQELAGAMHRDLSVKGNEMDIGQR